MIEMMRGLFGKGPCVHSIALLGRLILPVLVCLSLGVRVSLGSEPERNPTGLAEPSAEELREIAARRIVPGAIPKDLPRRVVNHQYLPTVGMQIIGSCATWASAYYQRGWQEARENGWVHPGSADQTMSPAMVYNMLAEDADQGVSLAGAFNFLARHGTTTWGDFPETGDISRVPTVDLWKKAAVHRAGSWGVIYADPADGMAALKSHLASGDVAVGTIMVSQNFDAYRGAGAVNGPSVSNGVITAYAGDPSANRGAHAVCFIGYDDDIAYTSGTLSMHGAFLAVNSWGQGWGVRCEERGESGFVWIGYDVVASTPSVGLSDPREFYVSADRIGYQPTDFAVIEYSHNRRNDVMMSLYTGDPANPTWWDLAFIRGGTRPFSGAIASDITGVMNPQAGGLSLRLETFGPSQLPLVNGHLERFELQFGCGPVLASLDAPMEIEEIASTLLTKRLNIRFMEQGAASLAQQSFPLPLADADGDGDLDMVADTRLMLNDGQGNFVAGEWPLVPFDPDLSQQQAAWADFNGDGLVDLALAVRSRATLTTRVLFLENRGDARLEEIPTRIDLGVQDVVRLYWLDANNDGILDIGTTSKIFLGLGAGQWSDSGWTPPALPGGAAAPVDLNADGLVDWGLAWNLGDGSFFNMPMDATPYPLVSISGIAYGDFNSDGLADVVLTGEERQGTPGAYAIKPIVHVFRNTGASLALHQANLARRTNGRATFADIDADGRLDLVLTASDSSDSFGPNIIWTSLTRVYIQGADGLFHDAGLSLDELGYGTVAAANLDDEPGIDIAWAGAGSKPADQAALVWGSRLASNRWSARQCGTTANQAPPPPTGLYAEVDGANGHATLRWAPPPDDRTPAASLAFRVRVGTHAGAADVVAPLPESPLVPHTLGAAPGRLLEHLPSGVYHWSVQAIDGSRLASAWSPESTFTIAGSPFARRSDPNADGVRDAADSETIARMVRGQIPPDIVTADLDGQAGVTWGDVQAMSQLLAGLPPAVPPGSAPIGPEGGRLETDGFLLVVPPGAFPRKTQLRVETIRTSAFDTFSMPTCYAIGGLPLNQAKPLTLALRDNRTVVGMPHIAIATAGFSRSTGRIENGWQVKPAEVMNGQVLLSLPVPDPASGTKADSDDDGKYTYNVGVLGGYVNYTTAHFSLGFPSATDTEQVERLATTLEAAYTRFTQPDMGFSYARRTAWPIDVCLRGGLADIDGYQTNDIRGINYGSLTYNTRILADETLAKATAGHEFFHMVQSFYDPRNRVSMAWAMPPQWWLEEATAPWSEELFTGVPGTYVPSVTKDNMTSPFTSVPPPPSLAGTDIAAHGYGLASIVRYLVKRPEFGGMGFPLRMHSNIYNGQAPLDALLNAADGTVPTWLPDAHAQILAGKVYPYDTTYLVGQLTTDRQRQFRVRSPGASIREYSTKADMPPMSALLQRVFLDAGAQIAADDRLQIALRAPVGTHLSLLRFSKTTKPEVIANEVPGADGALYLDIPNIGTALQQGWIYLPLLTSLKTRQTIPISLNMGIARTGPVPLTTTTVTEDFYEGRRFPTIQLQSPTLTASRFGEWHRTIWPGGEEIIYATQWGPYPQTFNLAVTARIIDTMIAYPYDDGTELRVGVSQPTGYELFVTRIDAQNNFRTESLGTRVDGKFTVSQTRSEGTSIYDLTVKYVQTETLLDKDGKVISQAQGTTSAPILFLSVDTR